LLAGKNPKKLNLLERGYVWSKETEKIFKLENWSENILRREVVMKKVLLITLTMLLIATWSFAADFTPSKMVITVPDEPIIYPFDGTSVDFDFDLSGTPAALWLVIETKLSDAEKPVAVENGFLGWHYVNKIDTTVYVSGKNTKDIGTGLSISWDGKSDARNGGGQVAPGQYTYYLWGYDDQNARTKVSDFISTGFVFHSQYMKMYELGEDGMPMTQPKLMGQHVHYMNTLEVCGSKKATAYKWTIGSDPHDASKLEWSWCPDYIETDNGKIGWGAPVFDPKDFGTYYHVQNNIEFALTTPLKWEFVSEGNSIKATDWGDWDNITWDAPNIVSGSYALQEAMWNDGGDDYILIFSAGQNPFITTQWDALRVIDFDGEEVIPVKQLGSLFYDPDDNNKNGWPNNEFDRGSFSRDLENVWIFACYLSCKIYMVDITRLLADSDDETDLVRWHNKNGDYFADRNWDEGSEQPWACIYSGYRDERDSRSDTYTLDKNNFLVMAQSYHGTSSFVLFTPDGTGVTQGGAFADDTVSSNYQRKAGGTLCHSGSAYDGLYFTNALSESGDSYGNATLAQTNWIGFDSAKGIIANAITAVEDEEVAAFSVDQNSPNPFNPTTAIGFNLVEDGKVSIDIFNVAGQKVDTLVNDFMTAGKHSVAWDANGFSAGVYFYTIKSGDFSKTMKMTLLK